MLFNSTEYFLLLLVSVAIYWMLPSQQLRRFLLFVASCCFYASWNASMLLLLWAVCLVHWFCALSQKRTGSSRFTVFAVTSTLVLLAYFKYSGFLLAQVGPFITKVGFDLPEKWGVILPLGISFYSFQLIAYSVDAKRGKFPVEKSPFDLFLFVMFFPHLIAGPICRPAQLIPQLKEKQKFEFDFLIFGFVILSLGLFLKVLFADSISPFVDQIFSAPKEQNSSQVLLGVLGYTVQILGDFWGYSTMALGSALMFGIRLPVNFNRPYTSLSLQEFWRRWHMTLSFWLRDYLYISLGGSKRGTVRTYINLMITMVLGGLWHGANWTFVIWGAIHGVALAIERFVFQLLPAGESAGDRNWPVKILRWLYTMSIVVAAWIFFRASTTDAAFSVFRQLVANEHSFARHPATKSVVIILLLFIPFHFWVHRELARAYAKSTSRVRAIGLSLILLYASLIFSATDVQKFIYFDF